MSEVKGYDVQEIESLNSAFFILKDCGKRAAIEGDLGRIEVLHIPSRDDLRLLTPTQSTKVPQSGHMFP